MNDGARAARIDACAQASLALLERNLQGGTILAASPTEAAQARRYTRVFGRDGAICVLAMCASGVPRLERAALATLDALATGQACNGQIPKYVDPQGQDADFWYLGCIDATLWWLLAADHVRRNDHACAGRWQAQQARAIGWLQAQEHPRLALLQQNEASDWADIMPRAGFVLYSNALWLEVKRRFALEGEGNTRAAMRALFDPWHAPVAEYHRMRLLQHQARRSHNDPGLWLSFVHLAGAGHEGDVLGNLLAILCRATTDAGAHAIVRAIGRAGAAAPYPVRVVLHPLQRADRLWRPYMQRHRQNLPHQYHNGGLWPFVGGFWVRALAQLGLRAQAWAQLDALARVNALDGWRFTEWFHGRSLAPLGMAGQSWNAATFLLALRFLQQGARGW